MRISDWSSDVCSSDLDHHHFEEILELHKADRNLNLDTELSAEDWKVVVTGYKAKVEEELRRPFPQDPMEQLWGAIGAVFGSRSDERRGGKECVSPCRSRGAPYT